MTRTVFEKAEVVPLVAEVFRELGYEGASLSLIGERTGLGKGSLYHFFPGGKEAMAAQILAHIDAWFVHNVFEPLEREEPRAAIARMWQSVNAYFRSGRRICLVGAFALEETRDRFAKPVRKYFARWIDALAAALVRAGVDKASASRLAEDVVLGIQGALVLARALNQEALFARAIARLRRNVESAIPRGGEKRPRMRIQTLSRARK
jgi:TetR/AcrR family transcriptional regulator, lmrAB and yxaGH operons repressor